MTTRTMDSIIDECVDVLGRTVLIGYIKVKIFD